jgi:hypothetical protein
LIVSGLALLTRVEVLGRMPDAWTESIGRAAALVQGAQTAMGGMQTVWRSLLEPVVPYAAPVAALLALGCLLFGAALHHLIFGRMVHR